MDVVTFLKLLLVPVAVLLASLAARKWGHTVSGYLGGMPMVGGPIAVYLAIDHGTKFAASVALVTLAARRARNINAYFNQLGEGLGHMIPPQVSSVSRKPLSIAFEEIAADKIVRTEAPEEPAGTGDVDLAALDGDLGDGDGDSAGA